MEATITFAGYLLAFLLALVLGARSVNRHHPALRQELPVAAEPQQP
ncbi:hypothetical protein [Cupriavidus basilensis]|nr:hypothetical protein [Cupriavidus basilensis]